MSILLTLSLLLPAAAPDDPSPPELGRVAWTRAVDVAIAASGRDGRPVFALFQEVPG